MEECTGKLCKGSINKNRKGSCITMAGKVFVSCGQRPPERKNALKIQKLLEDEFHLNAYLAFRVQSLNDIMTITRELRSSDYYLFVDFLRKPKSTLDFQVSLFTHQELALAHHLGFEDMIALQEQGAPLEGFLRYVLSNPEPFTDEGDLLAKIRNLVRDRGWSSSYSRNLVLQRIGTPGSWTYNDHSGTYQTYSWKIRVQNNRPDAAAVGSVCILDHVILPTGVNLESPDRSYLKWAGQAGYERTILPKDFGEIDLLSIHADRPGLFLHSLRDTPREPIVVNDGQYKLGYKLFSQGFPLIWFSVAVDLSWLPPSTDGQWPCNSTATLEAIF